MLPYLAYVFSFVFLQPYIDMNFDNPYGEPQSEILFTIKMTILVCLWLYFIKFEIAQMQNGIKDYLTDLVNMFDMSQYLLNLSIIIMFIKDYSYGDDILHSSA